MLWLLLVLGGLYIYTQVKEDGGPGEGVGLAGLVPTPTTDDLLPGVYPTDITPPVIPIPGFVSGSGFPQSLPFKGSIIRDPKDHVGVLDTASGGFSYGDIVVNPDGTVNLAHLISMGSEISTTMIGGVPIEMAIITANRSPNADFRNRHRVLSCSIKGNPLLGGWWIQFGSMGRFPVSERLTGINPYTWIRPPGALAYPLTHKQKMELTHYIPRDTPVQSVYLGMHGFRGVWSSRFIGEFVGGTTFKPFSTGTRNWYYPDGTLAENNRTWRYGWRAARGRGASAVQIEQGKILSSPYFAQFRAGRGI